MQSHSRDFSSAAALRAPDGTTWQVYNSGSVDWAPTDLVAVAQDPDTGQWHVTPGRESRTLPHDEVETTYTPIPHEPLRDPRITRLANLVRELLAEYETATGGPASCADRLARAVADVEAIPEEASRRAHGRAVQARRAGRRRY
ncbi:hypothetical protein [Saccharothrix xinjiangensis]|uniref:Uncharacterized protein n=1 Tax=Saccharothrix xinjiangensis TaxID=204798 RepID=A0ABV9XW80_9PSEU